MNQNLFFTPTDILLPAHADMRRWSVIACDQFTADAGYWQAVQDTVGDAPSTLRLMLPEFYLGKCDEAAATREIQQTMRRYLDDGVFRTVPHSLVLVQRTLPGGTVRCGIVGALDLEAYDYAPDSVTPIRATEGTVASRLPARVRIRAAAALEMPHIMVFYSDPEDTIRREAQAAAGETLYDFDLMSGGGHVRGLRIAGAKADALAARLCVTGVGTDGAHPMRFAIADGNHSLAAARLCWLEKKQTLTPEQAAADPARYALVELVNLHSPAVTFEPIHRVLFGTDASKWMQAAETALASTDGSGYVISLIAGRARRDIFAKGASLGEAPRWMCSARPISQKTAARSIISTATMRQSPLRPVMAAAASSCRAWIRRSSSRRCCAPARSRKRAFPSASARTSAITSSAANCNS